MCLKNILYVSNCLTLTNLTDEEGFMNKAFLTLGVFLLSLTQVYAWDLSCYAESTRHQSLKGELVLQDFSNLATATPYQDGFIFVGRDAAQREEIKLGWPQTTFRAHNGSDNLYTFSVKTEDLFLFFLAPAKFEITLKLDYVFPAFSSDELDESLGDDLYEMLAKGQATLNCKAK